MQEPSRARAPALVAWIALFVLLGVPPMAYLWETLNMTLAGNFDALRVAISVPVLALLYVLLILLARFVQRWDARQVEQAPPAPSLPGDPTTGAPGREAAE